VRKSYQGYVIVAVSFFIMFIVLGLQGSFGVFVKPVTDDLHWSRTLASGSFSLAQIIGGISFILMGILNDRFGLRAVVLACGALSFFGYLLMSWMQAEWQLFLYYGFLVGAGSGVFVPILSSVARRFSRSRSLMSGIVFSGSSFGVVALPPIINWLLSSYSWRTVFIFLAGGIFLIFAVAVLLLKHESRLPEGETIPNRAASADSGSTTRSYTFKEAVATRQFWLFCAMVISYGFCFFSILVHADPYITDLGYSSGSAAAVIAVIGGSAILGQVGFGTLGDRIGYRMAYLFGMLLILAAMSLLLLGSERWIFFAFAVLLGVASGDCGTQESPITAWLFGLESHGLIFGCFAFSFTLGAAIGPLVFGYIFDSTGSYRPAFALSLVVAAIGAVLTLLLTRRGLGKLRPET
jgi:MFS family permease